VGWGSIPRNSVIRQPQKIFEEPVALVAAGLRHNLLMTKNGDIYGFGDQSLGRLGFAENQSLYPPQKIEFSENPPVVLICGEHYSAAMTMDGSVYLMGEQVSGTKSDQIPKVLFPEFKFQLPFRVRCQKIWREIVFWIFLGYSDKFSLFYHLPKKSLLIL
jgi:alpha-tubulin suppressor-like RCC1 family protein